MASDDARDRRLFVAVRLAQHGTQEQITAHFARHDDVVTSDAMTPEEEEALLLQDVT